MRDLFVATIVFGALPFILKRPFLGILLLAGLGFMNPHRLCYGFMLTMPSVQIVALVTLVAMLASKEIKRMIWSREVIVLLMFLTWMGITTTQAFFVPAATEQMIKVIKIQILVGMTLVMLTTRERIHLLVWAIVLALAFYGIKGGLFTIAKGGVHRVQGPYGTFIGGNNELALALVMTIPLIRFLHLQEHNKYIKHGLMAAMLLTAISVIGSQSRGALVALSLTGVIFWVKSRHKLSTAVLIGIVLVAILSIMPAEWYERMNTIKTYDEDKSAMGRILAWKMAINLASSRLTGGGFETWQPSVFAVYGGGGRESRDVHSIYFEVLGEHGWIGLSLFLALLVFTWLKCGSIIRMSKKQVDGAWARDLASMLQVSLVAYMTAGAFLGLAYFDYIYYLMAITVALHYYVRSRQPEVATSTATRTPAVTGQSSLALLRHI